MSNIMLHGVLNMPIDVWSNDALDMMQRQSRYVEASKLILDQEAEIEKLKMIIERVEANNGKSTYKGAEND